MTRDWDGIALRVERLERAVRHARWLAATCSIALLATWVGGAARPTQSPETLRTKILVIEDAQGRARIRLGAPLPDERQSVGMQILSPEGAEQFGLGLRASGAVSMGFDVKPGVGHPGNRERLNMGVTATGQGWIRYLDNQTRARMWVSLDSADSPSVQFLDWPDDQRILVRQIGFSGERSFERKR